jgi:1,4-alpha-glucan branching enzyme
MSLKKQYDKKKPVCKVTFTIPKQISDLINTAHLVGDFNDWNTTATPMKRLKNGSFAATLTLRGNTEYQFRYFLDGVRWENDLDADKCVRNEYGSENSVLVV